MSLGFKRLRAEYIPKMLADIYYANIWLVFFLYSKIN